MLPAGGEELANFGRPDGSGHGTPCLVATSGVLRPGLCFPSLIRGAGADIGLKDR